MCVLIYQVAQWAPQKCLRDVDGLTHYKFDVVSHQDTRETLAIDKEVAMNIDLLVCQMNQLIRRVRECYMKIVIVEEHLLQVELQKVIDHKPEPHSL
jgi:hypothetical protein